MSDQPNSDMSEIGQIELPRIFVTDFGDMMCCQSSPVHRHPFYEMVWVSGGAALLFRDFQQYRVAANTIAFIAPGQIHQWQSEADESSLTIVGFTLDQLAYYGKITQVVSILPFDDIHRQPFVSFADTEAVIFGSLFQTIQDRFARDGMDHDDVVLAYLNLILVELERIHLPENPLPPRDAAAQLTADFRKLVEAEFLHHKQVQYYAELLGVTLNHLVETVRKSSGQTPKQIIKERLALEAKRLLIHTDDTVAEISTRLSFTTPTYFGSWFKHYAGLTPLQFRETAVLP